MMLLVFLYMAIGLIWMIAICTDAEVRREVSQMHPVSFITYIFIWMFLWPLIGWGREDGSE